MCIRDSFISDALPPLLAAGADAVARDGDGVNPLVALYDRERLLAALGDDARSLQQVAARLGARAVDAPARSLADADEPQDLRRLEG